MSSISEGQEIEQNQIEKDIQQVVDEFNEWNMKEEKDPNQIDEFVKRMKQLVDEIKKIQEETGSCPTNSEFLTNLLTISLVLNSYKTNGFSQE